MALLVETGAGVLGAESYATVADADTYWGGRPSPDATAWLAAQPGDKEGALRGASEYLDMNVLSPAQAVLTLGQGLAYPYESYEDVLGGLSLLRRATVMIAPLALGGPMVAQAPADPQVLSSTDKLGEISESRTFARQEGVVLVNGRDLSFLDRLLSGLRGGGIVLGHRWRG